MMNTKYFNIADFSIKLNSESNIEVEEGYLPFLSTDEISTPDVTVECFLGMPEISFNEVDLVFEAKNEQQKFYSIYQLGNELAFLMYNQQTKDEIQQVAYLDASYSNWRVYSDPFSDYSIWPLKYPFGPIMMHYLAVKSHAIMIHASCIFDGKTGRIFTGFSGNGKSTMSKIWADEGNLVINDDRIIIRKRNDVFYAYNTPMYYKDRPKSAPLSAIFLIRHSPENQLKKIAGALAVSKVLAFCIQNNFEQKLIDNHLNVVSELATEISVYELGFVPDASVVKFVLENETNGSN